jgi:hypothetical protein
MLEDVVENMPSWLKATVAIGAGSVAGIAIAKLLMMMGIGHG